MDAQVIGSYSLEAPLGRGAMGLVYRARHLALDKPVAIKFMMPALSDNPLFCARFLQEARLMGRIDHPNIVRVLDYGEYEDRRFLVMELLEGETLEDRLGRQPPPDAAEVVRIVRAILSALAEIHRQVPVVVHRDIKPANIFLCENGDIKVMDFGIAREMSQAGMTVTGSVVGTPKYMSPEQAEGRDVDARSDLYSTGVILYEMLSGRPLFTAETPIAILHMHVNRPVPPLPVSVPAHHRRVAERALAKQPAMRFASAKEMLQALDVAPKPPGRKWMAAAAAAVLVPAMGVGVVNARSGYLRDRAEVIARLAFVDMTHNRLAPAEKQARAALDMDPRCVDARAALGAALVEAYNDSGKPDDLARAQKELAPLLSHPPESAYANAALGALVLAAAPAPKLSSEYEKARAPLDAAIKRDPKLAYAYFKLSVVENYALAKSPFSTILGADPKAEEQDLQRALQLDPHIAWARTAAAELHFAAKRYPETEEAAHGEIEDGAPTARTYILLALAQSWQNRHADAQAALRKAIELDPSNGKAHNYLAGELYHDYAAQNSLSVSVSSILRPSLSTSTDWLKSLKLTGLLIEARTELQRAIDLGYDPDSTWVYKSLASRGYAPFVRTPSRSTPPAYQIFAPLGTGLAITMPGAPETVTGSGPGRGWRVLIGNARYFVYYWDVPTKEGTAEQAMNKSLANRQNVVTRSDIAPSSGARGRDIHWVASNSRTCYARYYATGQRLYEAGVSVPSSEHLPTGYLDYLNTFKITGSAIITSNQLFAPGSAGK